MSDDGAAKMQRVTLSELEAECRKAARGIGCPWGMAEEAGKAARWLAAHGLPGPEAMARFLSTRRRCCCAESHSPSPATPHCPIAFGAELNDRAEMLAKGETIAGADIAYPLIVLAFAGQAATALKQPVRIEWPEFEAICLEAGLHLDRGGGVAAARAGDVGCAATAATSASATRTAEAKACDVEQEAWRILQDLAQRTYVPSNAANRIAGAGAGLADND
ncbi:MAG: DUF3726 domain-containing protein [Pseudomonadota bacterium]